MQRSRRKWPRPSKGPGPNHNSFGALARRGHPFLEWLKQAAFDLLQPGALDATGAASPSIVGDQVFELLDEYVDQGRGSDIDRLPRLRFCVGMESWLQRTC
jgi:hypothetical protein